MAYLVPPIGGDEEEAEFEPAITAGWEWFRWMAKTFNGTHADWEQVNTIRRRVGKPGRFTGKEMDYGQMKDEMFDYMLKMDMVPNWVRNSLPYHHGYGD